MWVDLARSCMWWWPYRNICVLSERPAEVHSPDGQHLHNDAGPAIRFRDGWCVWAINGVPVDEEIVLHPETQSLRKIRGEQNAEVKRIRIERYGWDRYLAGVRAVVIDRSRNDIEATAETLMRGPDGETVLVCAAHRRPASMRCRYRPGFGPAQRPKPGSVGVWPGGSSTVHEVGIFEEHLMKTKSIDARSGVRANRKPRGRNALFRVSLSPAVLGFRLEADGNTAEPPFPFFKY